VIRREVLRADWKNPADVLKAYASASIVGDDRVVFNIKGNDYRLVVIAYRHRIVFIS
jgi:mRNA interferase HigB